MATRLQPTRHSLYRRRSHFCSFGDPRPRLCSTNTKATSRLIRRAWLAKLNSGSNDIKAEIIDLFAAKLLNFVRNPFSIQKVLNSFPGLASYDPTDPALLAEYRRIVSGKKPHQA